jgi:hypothetical protein
MPQGPLSVDIANNPANARVALKTDVYGNLLVATLDQEQVVHLNVTTATSLKLGSGQLDKLNNLNSTNLATLTTTQLNLLTTTSIGSLYDASFAVGALTTTQVATLATTQLLALAPQTVATLAYNAKFSNGLVFVPGVGQAATVVNS